jgi:N-acetylglucosaminyldiphosphoundecaprenol N-acetyl-beta-D-mannosaminyltransferase
MHILERTQSASAGRSEPGAPAFSKLRVLGVEITNASQEQAIDLIERMVCGSAASSKSIYIVNAHTLNLACESPAYRRLLNGGEVVFADGTGVRWAARLRGVRMQANLVGTDLIPALFHATGGRGYRYFLLGANAATIQRAAATCERTYPGWTLAGFHHGYVQDEASAALVIKQINASRAHILLVGMGNPLQEQWIHRHRASLQVQLSIGVGGLFDHWAGNLKRAPAWVRRHGFEWTQLLLQQPQKWRRYLLGNPKFLVRILAHLPRERLLISAKV